MKKCLVCGFETSDNEMMYCSHCGNKLSEQNITVTLKFNRSNLPFIKDGFDRYLNNAEEAYATKNAVNLGINLRAICESLLNYAFTRYPGIQTMNFSDQLEYAAFNVIIDEKCVSLFNNIRRDGNKCAHGGLDYSTADSVNYEYEELVKEFDNIISQIRKFVESDDIPERLYKSQEDYDNSPLLYRDKKAYAKKIIGIYDRGKLLRLVLGVCFGAFALVMLLVMLVIFIAMFLNLRYSGEGVMGLLIIMAFFLLPAYATYEVIYLPQMKYKKDQKGYEYKTLYMDFSKVDHYSTEVLVDYSINWEDLKKMAM